MILEVLKEKAAMKQRVYEYTFSAFKEIKEIIRLMGGDLNRKMSKIDGTVFIDFMDRGDFEVRLKLGGDTLVFLMHTNVFQFDKDHSLWNTSYVSEDEMRSYAGMINVYNFLSDSFKYNRVNDVGYLIARVFINRDRHFYVEGKRQLGYLYNDFDKPFTSDDIKSIVESCVLYSLDFDLLTPPYRDVQEISVSEMIEVAQINRIKTGKRLGFKFEADGPDVK